MSESEKVIAEKDSSNNGGNFDAFANANPHEESTILHTKNFALVAAILLEKGLFKISLLVPVRFPLWVGLFSIKLVVTRMLYLCS